ANRSVLHQRAVSSSLRQDRIAAADSVQSTLMHRFLLLAATAVCVFAVDTPGNLYEEEVKASVPIRNRAWHLMQKYIDGLREKSAPAGTTLARRIGYPAPQIQARQLRLE